MLDELIEQEVLKMRRERRAVPKPQPVVEPKEGTVLNKMVNAAMPSVVRGMKARQKEAAQAAKQEQKEERASAGFLTKRLPPALDSSDGEAVYEQAVPDFI